MLGHAPARSDPLLVTINSLLVTLNLVVEEGSEVPPKICLELCLRSVAQTLGRGCH